MFRPIDARPEEATITMSFDGQPVYARPGDTVAIALAGAGISSWRETPRTGAPRGAFCMMGACFDCLVVIDGVPNRQACMVMAAEGMTITRQRGSGE